VWPGDVSIQDIVENDLGKPYSIIECNMDILDSHRQLMLTNQKAEE
jgi:hypothetical protein